MAAKLGSGKRFASLKRKVMGEGYSAKSAAAIAAVAGRKAHGPTLMKKWAAAGKRRKSK